MTVHALAAAGVLASGLAGAFKLALGAGVLAHALGRRPGAPTPLARRADGSWALPALGAQNLTLRRGSAVGPFWARLCLAAPDGTRRTLLLVRDQMDTEDWRRLQAALRTGWPSGSV